jgi:hypothetical protein
VRLGAYIEAALVIIAVAAVAASLVILQHH